MGSDRVWISHHPNKSSSTILYWQMPASSEGPFVVYILVTKYPQEFFAITATVSVKILDMDRPLKTYCLHRKIYAVPSVE